VATATPLGLPAHDDQNATILHTLGTIYAMTKKCNPKNLNIQLHHCVNLKCTKFFLSLFTSASPLPPSPHTHTHTHTHTHAHV